MIPPGFVFLADGWHSFPRKPEVTPALEKQKLPPAASPPVMKTPALFCRMRKGSFLPRLGMIPPGFIFPADEWHFLPRKPEDTTAPGKKRKPRSLSFPPREGRRPRVRKTKGNTPAGRKKSFLHLGRENPGAVSQIGTGTTLPTLRWKPPPVSSGGETRPRRGPPH